MFYVFVLAVCIMIPLFLLCLLSVVFVVLFRPCSYFVRVLVCLICNYWLCCVFDVVLFCVVV